MFYCIEYLMVDFPIRPMRGEMFKKPCFENLKIYLQSYSIYSIQLYLRCLRGYLELFVFKILKGSDHLYTAH